MYRLFTKLYPPFLTRKIKRLLKYTDLHGKSDKFIGFTIFSSLSSAFFAAFVTSSFLRINLPYTLLIMLALFIAFQAFFYFTIIFRADSRARFIESVLPDALQLIASNLKAGFTVEKSVLLSTRPEFGAFSEELSIVGREITTGKSVETALMEMTERVKSEKFEKTITLIVHGIRSGGKLAQLLSQTSQNLRNQALMEERVRTSVLTYFIFILSAVVFASPVLFALSSFLSQVMINQLSAVQIPEGIASPITIQSVNISAKFIIGFIVAILATLDIFGSFVLGLISKGKAKEGVKYIPILLLLSIGLFFLVRIIIGRLFSGLIL